MRQNTIAPVLLVLLLFASGWLLWASSGAGDRGKRRHGASASTQRDEAIARAAAAAERAPTSSATAMPEAAPSRTARREIFQDFPDQTTETVHITTTVTDSTTWVSSTTSTVTSYTTAIDRRGVTHSIDPPSAVPSSPSSSAIRRNHRRQFDDDDDDEYSTVDSDVDLTPQEIAEIEEWAEESASVEEAIEEVCEEIAEAEVEWEEWQRYRFPPFRFPPPPPPPPEFTSSVLAPSSSDSAVYTVTVLPDGTTATVTNYVIVHTTVQGVAVQYTTAVKVLHRCVGRTSGGCYSPPACVNRVSGVCDCGQDIAGNPACWQSTGRSCAHIPVCAANADCGVNGVCIRNLNCCTRPSGGRGFCYEYAPAGQCPGTAGRRVRRTDIDGQEGGGQQRDKSLCLAGAKHALREGDRWEFPGMGLGRGVDTT